jgi:hypothetical protein
MAMASTRIRLAQDAALPERLGATGRDRVSEQFRHQNMTRKIRDVSARVLAGSEFRR